jgi:hypothetical protein
MGKIRQRVKVNRNKPQKKKNATHPRGGAEDQLTQPAGPAS